MDRPSRENAEDNLLKSEERNNIHSTGNEEAGLGTAVDHHRENTASPGIEGGDDEDSVESDSDSSDDEHHEFPPDSLRGKLHPIMKSNPVQYTIIALVIADCLIIVVELLIDMEIVVFPENEPQNATDLLNSSHPIAYDAHDFNHSIHHDHWPIHGAHYIFMNNSSSNHTDDGHDGHHHHHHHTNKEKAQHVLHMLSLAILSVFMVEVCLKIFVEREHLLKQKAEVFDAIVVIISFTLDVIFTFVSVSSVASDAAGLMVLLRLWRVTRIINGVVMSVKHDAKMKMAVQKKISRKLERENRKLRSKIEKLERDNANLRQRLRESKTFLPDACDPKTGGAGTRFQDGKRGH
ncbi:hypothetical protein RRG08_008996 [Elysia crispata]|uniref:Voltage-gated hydrogen channel 1 n=1 Tax=Elysia crispata TaxID=231223 RepID=A0AAE0YUJ8_9GAST|nr:hypothetical protein RRG08_008996 [Elysia crispata]